MSKYLIEYRCTKCLIRAFIDSADGKTPGDLNFDVERHLCVQPGVGFYNCGPYEKVRVLIGLMDLAKDLGKDTAVPDFPMSGVDSKTEIEHLMHFTLPETVLRCFVCKMPMSRPLTPTSHLPDCWFREVIARLNKEEVDV